MIIIAGKKLFSLDL